MYEIYEEIERGIICIKFFGLERNLILKLNHNDFDFLLLQISAIYSRLEKETVIHTDYI